MPARKKKAYSRPGYYSCGKMVVNDASKALSLAKHAMALINVEFKRRIQQATSLAVANTPVLTLLTNLAQGDTAITRDGAHAKFVSIRWNYFISSHASALFTCIRCMVVMDKQTNEAAFTAADLLNDVTSSDSIVSDRQRDHLKRFTVLYDKVHTLSPSSPAVINRRWYKKLNLPVQYDGAAGDVTDLTQKSLWLVFFSNQSTNTPLITFDCTLRYIDN